jgi:hypothetical protein
VLCLSLLPVAIAPAAAHAQTPEDECAAPGGPVRSTEADAAALAARCDRPVEILDWRSVDSQSFALEGGLVRTELYTEPQWTVDAAGTWVDIDPTLAAAPGGAITTTATVSDIAVSPGGEGPFVSVTAPGGGTFGLVWPEPLPEPHLDGGSATYPSVLPGVDLRVDVGNERVGYVLVVHTPQAARSPELARIDVEVVAFGLDVVQDDETGLLHAVDEDGTTLYASEPALMWDSSTVEPAEHEAPEAALDAVDPLDALGLGALGLDGASESPSSQSASEPAAAGLDDVQAQPGRIEEMTVDFDGTTLSVTPDAAMLADPDTEYPVYIDPTFSGELKSYANVHQQRPNTSMLARGADLRVGLQLWENDSTLGLWRAAVRFDTAALASRYVQSAKVQVTQTHLAGCANRNLRIWRVKAVTGANTTWNNIEIMEGGYLQSKSVATSNKTTCGGTNQVVTFDNSNVTSVLRKVANAGNASVSFMFQSSNEDPNNNGAHAWRRLSVSSAKLTVDHRPKSSTGLKTDGANCSTSGPGPWVASTRPQLTAKAPQFTGSSGWLKFHLYTAGSDSNFHNWWVSANSGQTVTTTVPSGQLTAGKTYRWRVLAYDSKTGDAAWQDMARCWFRVNTTPQVPSSPQTDGIGCGTEASPTLITTRTPNLSAIPQDPDGGNVRLRILVYESTGSNIHNWYVDGKSGTRAGGRLKSGVVTADGLYRWRSNTHDQFGGGDYTAYCWLRIDTTVPEPPDAVQVTSNPVPGQPVTFDLIGSSDVTQFRYALQGQTVRTGNASGGRLRVTVTPPTDSIDHVLQVWARDAAGNESSRTDVWFTTAVATQARPAAVWRFDGDGFDDSGLGNDAGAASGLAFTADRDGRTDAALSLDTTAGSCAMSDGPVLDTTDSYTVAAWVRVEDGTGDYPKLFAQGAAVRGAFYLEWNRPAQQWRFQLAESDDATTTWAVARSSQPPPIGQWHHVAGVYDAPAERVRLYIDGELQSSAPVPFEPLPSAANLSVGCMNRTNGEIFGVLDAAVDDAAVFQQVLTGSQIGELMEGRNLPAGLQAWYPLRGDAADHSGRDAHLDVASPQWTSDHHGRATSALRLDGTTCPTAAAPVRTDDSFSVSTWVRLDPQAGNADAQVFSLNGANAFAAVLKHDASRGGWAVGVTAAAGSAPVWSPAIPGTADPGRWTHLALTVDRADARANVYVDGALAVGFAVPAAAWRSGGLAIGCDRDGGSRLTGDLADVRLWRGVVTPEQIAGVPTELLAYWELDETLQGTDTRGGHDLAFHGAHDWVENRFNECFAAYGLDLAGGGYGRTAGPVVTTDESFTVAAWIRLADAEDHRTVLAQSGTNRPGFTLGYSVEEDRFEFATPAGDAASADWSRVHAVEGPEIDDDDGTSPWYHLAGQVDLGAGVIRLFVDGELQGQAPIADAPWRAQGAFTVGAALTGGQPTDYMVGTIDQVHAYSGVLDANAVARLASERPLRPIAPDGSCDEDGPPGDW